MDITDILTSTSFIRFKNSLEGADVLDMILTQNPSYVQWCLSGPLDFRSYSHHWTYHFRYNYKKIKEDRGALNRILNEYLYHPDRIQKWLDGGNNIEDYLNY